MSKENEKKEPTNAEILEILKGMQAENQALKEEKKAAANQAKAAAKEAAKVRKSDCLVNMDRINMMKTRPERMVATTQELRRIFDKPGAKPYLTQIMNGNRAGNTLVREMLAENEKTGMLHVDSGEGGDRDLRWKLRVLCDEFGKPVKPKSIHRWKRGIRLKNKNHKTMTTQDHAYEQMQGRSLDTHGAQEVDKDGCVSLPFSEAASLLVRHGKGVHLGGAWSSDKKIAYIRYEEVQPWEVE